MGFALAICQVKVTKVHTRPGRGSVKKGKKKWYKIRRRDSESGVTTFRVVQVYYRYKYLEQTY